MTTIISALLIKSFQQIIGENNVLIDLPDRIVYECDAETVDQGIPDLVLLPGSTAEVAQVVRLASQHQLKIIPRGAGTGLSGGATPYLGGICLALTRMKKIMEINPQLNMVHVETGITNVEVSKACLRYGLQFPCDPSSQLASTIGGNIAENAGGAHTLKCGTTGAHVNGIVMVNAIGDIVTLGQKFNNPLDLDFLHLVIGSEGTLGIVCEAYLNITAIPQSIETAVVYFDSLEQAAYVVSDIIAHGIIPGALELIDDVTIKATEASFNLGLNTEAEAMLLIELDGSCNRVFTEKTQITEILTQHTIISMQWAKTASDRQNLWKARKSAFASLGRLASHGYVLDGVIPRSKLAIAISLIRQIANKHDLKVANVYHAGDGNLHPCLLFNKSNPNVLNRVLIAAREILLVCLDLGGTLSGEHGIGLEKLWEMNDAFTSDTIDFMQTIKNVFDPRDLFNPGKVLPNPKLCGESRIDNLARFKLSC